MSMTVKPNKQLMNRKTKKEEMGDDVIDGEVISGKNFDPKKIENTNFYHNQRVSIIDGFYKGSLGIALDRKVKITIMGPVITYQIQLDSLDIVECYTHEIAAV